MNKPYRLVYSSGTAYFNYSKESISFISATIP